MAKRSAGLPGDFDLKVGRSDIMGPSTPARLPGYLDRGLGESFTNRAQVNEPIAPEPRRIEREPESAPVRLEQIVERPAPRVALETKPVEKVRRQPAKVERIIMNATPDIEKKASELLDLLGRQSPDGRVTITELMQALLIMLYDARDDINGSLPHRGRWGSPTAKSFPIELAKVFQEALRKSWGRNKTDSFKALAGNY